MNNGNKSEQQKPTPKKLHPNQPEDMELMEYLAIKEKAKSYISMVMYLYSNLAFKENDPEQKEQFDNESNRHADLLRSMTWMDVEVARPIVAEYPKLISQLEEKDERSDA